MYLIDTNVVSELRKRGRADRGVVEFFDKASALCEVLYLSVISVGELRRGIELIRYRGDAVQAQALEAWLADLLQDFSDRVLPFDADAAQTWGRLRVPNAQHEIDKQIAAIAWVHDLTVVTRNTSDFAGTGVRLLNPFAAA